ncbi:DNA-3-methyladenine glycosylase family protein [Brevibacterium litoralis]|uniref:DNA-3-methyladenine glycosylase family protein n=1 Tax=Brevibacterium litoralis TaxID=3138935 RepID=UPI0032EB44B8
MTHEFTARLPVTEPFDGAGVLAWMEPRALPGVEEVDADSFSRTVRLPHGPAWFRVRIDSGRGPELTAHLTDPADEALLLSLVRRLFDLDTDPREIDGALAAEPVLAPLVAEVPGIRVPGAADPHEMLVRAMVGQQISVAAARTHLTRLAEALGERVEIAGTTRLLFPTAEALAADGHTVLRGPTRRVAAIIGAAEALAEGSLVLGPEDDPFAQRRALMELPGIGAWTADYVRMRVAHDPDVLLPGDLVLRQGAEHAGAPAAPKDLATWAERLAPWRSYASAHFWRHALRARRMR